CVEVESDDSLRLSGVVVDGGVRQRERTRVENAAAVAAAVEAATRAGKDSGMVVTDDDVRERGRSQVEDAAAPVLRGVAEDVAVRQREHGRYRVVNAAAVKGINRA